MTVHQPRSRNDFVKLAIELTGKPYQDLKILEIGPYMSPLITDRDVDTFDVLSHEDLVTRGKSENGPYYLIPPVTWIGTNASPEYINKKFDLILSSHVVEHQIDLIEHFQNIQNLLEVGGIYAALIPDHRYCFDHFNSPSSIVDVLIAHKNKGANHTLKSFLEDRLTTSHNTTIDYWAGKPGEEKFKNLTLAAIENLFDEYSGLVGKNSYVDVHAWKFTEKTFLEIFMTLNRWGSTRLAVIRSFPVQQGNNEFWVLFRKDVA